MRKTWIPAAGDIVSIDFDPQAGHEQAGRRPALVLSDVSYNFKASLAVVCPITSRVKGYPFEVPIPTGSKVTGVVLSDQVKSIDWRARNARQIHAAPPGVLDKVRRHLALILGLS